MTSEDLRRQNASLYDRIQQVLEIHPELQDLTEAIALNQDLHVEVGTPFLERTRDKLIERARAITKRSPRKVGTVLSMTSHRGERSQECDYFPREQTLTAALARQRGAARSG